MNLLCVTDRLSLRGGADLHFRDIIAAAVQRGLSVRLVVGRVDPGVSPPAGVPVTVSRGLGRMVADPRRLSALDRLLPWADVVHAQNIMNPVALSCIAQTGRAVVTIQDHRHFCPGPGKTLPSGHRCTAPMNTTRCADCLPDADYRTATLGLTKARLCALHGASLVVLSRYMAEELALVGLHDAAVIPPWLPRMSAPTHDRDRFVIGGRLVQHKAILTAWQGWQDAGRPLPLCVAGEGPLLSRLTHAQPQGWLQRSELHTLLGRARALLFPARWQEPFGILGAEALACGTPVILTPRGGMTDWAMAGCMHAHTPADFQQAITTLANNPGQAQALGQAGQHFIQTHFSEERLAPRLWALYALRASERPDASSRPN